MGGRGSGGHNRKPASLHLLAGTYRPDRHGRKVQPVAPEQVPIDPPAWVGEHGAAFWRQYRPICLRLGTLDALSQPLFECLCAAYHEFMALHLKIQADGPVLETARGPRAHPLMSAQRQWLRLVERLMDGFGLTPLGRQRLGIELPPDEPDDPLEALRRRAQQKRGDVVEELWRLRGGDGQ